MNLKMEACFSPPTHWTLFFLSQWFFFQFSLSLSLSFNSRPHSYSFSSSPLQQYGLASVLGIFMQVETSFLRGWTLISQIKNTWNLYAMMCFFCFHSFINFFYCFLIFHSPYLDFYKVSYFIFLLFIITFKSFFSLFFSSHLFFFILIYFLPLQCFHLISFIVFPSLS